jgi:hypothetical protein
LDVGSVITHGWESYSKNIGAFIAMQFIVLVICVVVGFVFMAPLLMMMLRFKTSSPEGLASGAPAAAIAAGGGAMVVVGYILLLLLSAFFYGGLIKAYLKATRGETVVLNDLFSGGSLFGYMLLAMIVLGIVIGIGMVLLIIPGLFLALMFSMTLFVVVDRRADPFGAMSKSWGMVMANFGPVFVVLLVLAIITVVVGLLSAIPILGILVQLANFLVVSPFLLCSVATLYDRLTASAPAGPTPPVA